MGAEEGTFEAERARASSHLLHSRVGVVHGQRADADEAVGVLRDLRRDVVV